MHFGKTSLWNPLSEGGCLGHFVLYPADLGVVGGDSSIAYTTMFMFDRMVVTFNLQRNLIKMGHDQD